VAATTLFSAVFVCHGGLAFHAETAIFFYSPMSPLQKGQSHREEAKRAKIFKKLKENLLDFSRKPSKS